MEVQKTGPDSVLVVLDTRDGGITALRECARAALEIEGIDSSGSPELTAFSIGDMTIVFVRANTGYSYFIFDSGEDLMDAAAHIHNIRAGADAKLLRYKDKFYIKTRDRRIDTVIGEYARAADQSVAAYERYSSVIIDRRAFDILSGE